MSYEIPGHRLPAISEVLEALLEAKSVVLTTHMNSDGDGLGSEVALGAWLRAKGKEVSIVNPTPIPPVYEWLVPDPSWVCLPDEAETARRVERADLAVVLDTGEIPRIGRVRPLIRDMDTVVVDHHPTGDAPIPGISFRDPTASATGELVYDLLQAAKGPWPQAAREGIYVAILTDTGSFRFSNATPGCHRIAGNLIETGIDPEEMHRRVWGSSPIRRFVVLRECLEHLHTDSEESRIAWMMVPREVVERLGARPDDLEGLVDYPRAIEGVEVGLLFRQTAGGDTKISFRSNGLVDVNALARQFGGGGHVKASGAMVKGPPHKVVPKVIDACRIAVGDL